LTGAAVAAIENSHSLSVRLPDGAIAHVRYFGDTPPQIRIEAAPRTATPAEWMVDPEAFAGPDVGEFARAAAEMDRQEALMAARMQQVMTAAPGGVGLMQVDLGRLPPGANGYSFVSTVSGRGVCTRSVEYRSTGEGKPQVISRSSGDCAAAPSAAVSPLEAGPTASPGATARPELTPVVYHPPS
jgi:hypothetical protein